MSAIGTGSWVMCVQEDLANTIVKDGVYVVAAIGTPPLGHYCYRCRADDSAVFLAHEGAASRGYCPCHFRPLGGNARAVERAAPAELEPA